MLYGPQTRMRDGIDTHKSVPVDLIRCRQVLSGWDAAIGDPAIQKLATGYDNANNSTPLATPHPETPQNRMGDGLYIDESTPVVPIILHKALSGWDA